MKRILLIPISTLLFIVLFPLLLGIFNVRTVTPPDTVPPSNMQNGQPLPHTVTCLDTKTGTVNTVILEDYLIGVLAAEMPAGYESEALKAQAVAARSYILYKVNSSNSRHPQATICTDSTHCKGWLSENDAKSRWKAPERDANWQKLTHAVRSTSGEYLTYNNNIVEACFFASDGGRTENSEDVWQASLPYLRSVESPASSESAKSQVSYTKSEFIQLINNHLSAPLSPEASITVTPIRLTQGGSIAEIDICGTLFRGTDIRKIFELKSANFTVTVHPDKITFDVIGNGHGVGMSQTGANQMAKEGKNYTEILLHYYTNVQIVKL